MKTLKILVLLSYYNRPKWVRNALKSVLLAGENYDNWVLAFGDDGSEVPGSPIVQEVMREKMEKVTVIHTGDTFEDKIRKGISIGRHANAIMMASDADIAIMLCDDDELDKEYFSNLNQFFSENPRVLHAYSKIRLFNPIFQSSDSVNQLDHKYNFWSGPIDASAKVDASQVAWRLDCVRRMGARFPESTNSVEEKPWITNIDQSFFGSLFSHCGPCHPTGFVSQSKGIHEYQLNWHKNTNEFGLRKYDEMIKAKAGELF